MVLLPHSKKVKLSRLHHLCGGELHVLSVSGYSSFLTQSNAVGRVGLYDDSKLPITVNVSANGCLFLCVRLLTCPGCNLPLALW